MPGPPRLRQQDVTDVTPAQNDSIIPDSEILMRATAKARSPVGPPPWRAGSDRPAPAPVGPPPAPRGQIRFTPNDMRSKPSVISSQRCGTLTQAPPLLEDQTGVYFRERQENICDFRLRYNSKTPMTVMYEDERSGGKLWIGSGWNLIVCKHDYFC